MKYCTEYEKTFVENLENEHLAQSVYFQTFQMSNQEPQST